MKLIEIQYSDLEKEVVEKYLKGNIFHVTPEKNYKSIKKDGFIYSPNPEKYGTNFPQSNICYGYKENCVCLLDFRKIDSKSKLYETATEQIYNNGYIFILDETIYNRVIPSKNCAEFTELNATHYFIPEYECWYPEKISLDDIKILLHIKYIESEKEKYENEHSLLGLCLKYEKLGLTNGTK